VAARELSSDELAEAETAGRALDFMRAEPLA
jgi:hypothetical protein